LIGKGDCSAKVGGVNGLDEVAESLEAASGVLANGGLNGGRDVSEGDTLAGGGSGGFGIVGAFDGGEWFGPGSGNGMLRSCRSGGLHVAAHEDSGADAKRQKHNSTNQGIFHKTSSLARILPHLTHEQRKY
jgi:hypothetical protein